MGKFEEEISMYGRQNKYPFKAIIVKIIKFAKLFNLIFGGRKFFCEK